MMSASRISWPAKGGFQLELHHCDGTNTVSDLHTLNSDQHASETDSFTPYRYGHFCKYLGGVERILDVGCNTGRGGSVIRSVYPTAQLVGLEMVERRVLAIPAGLYEELHVGDLSVIGHQLGSFGAIVMGEVIEHVPLDAIPAFIGGLRELLAPGGHLLLTTPNPSLRAVSEKGRHRARWSTRQCALCGSACPVPHLFGLPSREGGRHRTGFPIARPSVSFASLWQLSAGGSSVLTVEVSDSRGSLP